MFNQLIRRKLQKHCIVKDNLPMISASTTEELKMIRNIPERRIKTFCKQYGLLKNQVEAG
jgi:hypothetical protein